jgi:Tfp pilus assembly protein PilO
MNITRKTNSSNSAGVAILRESMKHGPVVTFAVMTILSVLLGYLFYSYVLSDWSESNRQYREQVIKKELDNKSTENMLASEPQFRAKFKKIVDFYQEAQPLLPEETEISEVLGQVEAAARRNGVTLAGLMAVKDSVKSPKAAKLYEREIPATVTGSYPQVVRFFTDISRMPRILLVRDYSVISMKNTVSAGFTLVAYHAPPPVEKPAIPTELTVNQNPEGVNNGQ